MSVTLTVTPEAMQQADEADTWWREHRSPRDGFLKEFTEAMAMLAEFPDLGPPFARRGIPGLRRLLLRRVQYQVYYVHDAGAGALVILAVWSTARGRRPRLKLP